MNNRSKSMTLRTGLLIALGFDALLMIVGVWLGPKVATSPPCALESYKDPSRHALVLSKDPYGDVVEKIVYLEQGWEPKDSMDFYTRTQGSRLLPYSWFLHLEQPENEQRFRDPANITRLRYLPQSPNDCNPDGLPVGFVKDPKRKDGKEDWLGQTCSACHTTQINYNKVGYRIDGGPTMADQETFLRELAQALKNTAENQAKFDRFAANVLGAGHSKKDKDDLKTQLAQVSKFRGEFDARNKPDHAYGFARLDAFGRILNEVLVRGIGVTDKDQVKVPNAPVSYPFLWDTPQHDFVQWNGLARNKIGGSETIGALTRNVGEVLGVFGEVVIKEGGVGGGIRGYDSSVRVPDLVHTENLIKKLQSPLWPDDFPPIDEAKRKAGADLFRVYCADCHHDIKRTDPNRKVKAHMTPIDALGTDPKMAENFDQRRGKTGRLKGRRTSFVVGPEFRDEAGGDEILVHVVIGVILNTPFNQYKESDLLELRKPVVRGARNLLKYKGRPLNGIWATAPYLHNGSVPNLYQLLLPSEKRVSEFWVGRREFDPKHVGFKTDKFPGGFLFRTKDEKGAIPGNSNAGHEYGTGKPKADGGDGLPKLEDKQIWELVEYMKSL
jgi:hypothetical protein